ncbi:bll4831 [Bradyrhizobium diazoefficiens USDA 110]|uniref:Bll4831 protein n=3 Tax=Bradyrhizobium TaxID=374 RepID=Q89KS2_BRADU|nr:DUF2171 domain-containing protein [Bradyrhizobium diazoefficiens]QBP23613.1 DUF2171 domain-containing protein [Bradyrhizobium diazoefficiens]BAC50096.1 bll4831 [Bradyrhizobium diazoefficiens USDA 110]
MCCSYQIQTHSSRISAPVRSRSAFGVRRYRRELRVASATPGLRGTLNHLRRASAAFGTASCHDLARLCGGGVESSLILPRPAPYETFGSIDPNPGCPVQRQNGRPSRRAVVSRMNGKDLSGVVWVPNEEPAMQNIAEHMEVIGADGVHIGTVDKVEGHRIKLTKKDSGEGSHRGHHHFIDKGLVAGVEGNKVRLSAKADVAVTMEEEK